MGDSTNWVFTRWNYSRNLGYINTFIIIGLTVMLGSFIFLFVQFKTKDVKV